MCIKLLPPCQIQYAPMAAHVKCLPFNKAQASAQVFLLNRPDDEPQNEHGAAHPLHALHPSHLIHPFRPPW